MSNLFTAPPILCLSALTPRELAGASKLHFDTVEAHTTERKEHKEKVLGLKEAGNLSEEACSKRSTEHTKVLPCLTDSHKPVFQAGNRYQQVGFYPMFENSPRTIFRNLFTLYTQWNVCSK